MPRLFARPGITRLGIAFGLPLSLLFVMLWVPACSRPEPWSPEALNGREFRYTVLWQDQPVGELRERLHRRADGDWQLEASLDLATQVRGTPLRFREQESLQFSAQAPWTLQKASWSQQQGEQRATQGERERGGAGKAALDTAFTLNDWMAAARWVAARPVAGSQLQWRRFHAASGLTHTDHATLLTRNDAGEWLLAVRRDEEEWQSEWRLAGDGQPLRRAWGGGFSLDAERPWDRSQSPTDLYAAQNVRTDRPLGDARRVQSLSLRWPQMISLGLAEAPSQQVAAGFVFTDASQPGPLAALPEQTAALADEARYSLQEASLAARAKTLVAGAADRPAQVSRLLHFVAEHLRDADQLQARTATQLLRDGYGDCTEHAQLFVALARAVGLPAREVSGLVYLGDADRRFGGHAWAEVVIDERWVMVDPMWDLMPVTGAHLRMTDEQTLAAARIPAGLQFTVEAVRYR